MRLKLNGVYRYLLAAALAPASVATVLAFGSWAASGRDLVGPQDESVHRSSDASVYSEIAKVPEKEATKRNPFENDAAAVAAGGKLFVQHCAECHGNMAEGGKKAPPLRDKEVQDAPPGALFWILTNGVVRRGMPVWSKLPEAQRWQIVSFLKSLRGD